MKTTNKSSSLDRHKLKYEITPVTKPKISKPTTGSHDKHLSIRPKKIKRPGIIRTYFSCMLEVILA